MEELFETFGHDTYQRIAITVTVIVAGIVLNKISQRIIGRYLGEPEIRYRTSKAVARIIAFVAFLLVLSVWADTMRGVLTVVTVVGAGLAIAMREALLSFVGWTFIISRVPYKQGDRIEVNGVRGDVIDIRMLHTTVMEIGAWVDADQSTGRIMYIPNSWIYQHPVQNYNRGFQFIWNEIHLTVSFRSNWEEAREIMLRFARESTSIIEKQAAGQIREMAREYLVHYGILSPFVYVKYRENGIGLTLRYLCETRKRRGTEHALTMNVLRAFAEQGQIELAYPMVGVAPFQTPQFGPLPSPGDGGYKMFQEKQQAQDRAGSAGEPTRQ